VSACTSLRDVSLSVRPKYQGGVSMAVNVSNLSEWSLAVSFLVRISSGHLKEVNIHLEMKCRDDYTAVRSSGEEDEIGERLGEDARTGARICICVGIGTHPSAVCEEHLSEGVTEDDDEYADSQVWTVWLVVIQSSELAHILVEVILS